MQQLLRQNLITTADVFAKARKVKLSTLGRMAANDPPFFIRLHDESKTFTAKKYDDVMEWLSANWPDAAVWPVGVLRPSATGTLTSDDKGGRAATSSRGPTSETLKSRSAAGVRAVAGARRPKVAARPA